MRALLLLAFLVAALPAAAAEGELLGTLKSVREAGAVTLGYREEAVPFSFRNPAGRPVGYSIDLCLEVVNDIAAELGVATLEVRYRPVTAESRIPALVSGEIDLECGSTTANRTREKQVAFSPIIFVAGTKLLVNRDAAIASLRDLRGKTLVVTAGTTNETAVRALDARDKLGITIVTAPDHAASFAKVASGTADAFATDDVLLYGLIASSPNGRQFKVVGNYLSYEPYGLMFRRDDPAMADIVRSTFHRLAGDRELDRLYDRWFQRRLPSGEVLGIPMSAQLAAIFALLNDTAPEP
jgi:glutamate/aspartate transport system substrate-binding protein